MHKAIAMHYYLTGSAFQQIEDKYLLKAFEIANPSVVLPTHQQLAGSLLNLCFLKTKGEVDRSLADVTQLYCLSLDGWSNICGEPVVIYMVVSH